MEAGQETLNARFGEEILLTGYHLAREEIERGDILLLTLSWEAESRVSTGYKVFIAVRWGGAAHKRLADWREGRGSSRCSFAGDPTRGV